jgi:hypothetical protein
VVPDVIRTTTAFASTFEVVKSMGGCREKQNFIICLLDFTMFARVALDFDLALSMLLVNEKLVEVKRTSSFSPMISQMIQFIRHAWMRQRGSVDSWTR